MIQDGPEVVDSNLDGVINASEDLGRRADTYAEQLATQLRKGFIMNFPMDLYSIAEVSNTPSINWHLKNDFKIIKQSDNFVYFKYEI